MYGNSGVMSWNRVWNNMQTISNDISMKSSCPWTIVRDRFSNNYIPQLLRIPEKEQWCKNCCIDLNQSNATHLIVNPRGKCHEIKVFVPCRNTKVVVGYTCIYDASIPTDKRNGDHGPIVNGAARHLQAENTALTEQSKEQFDNSIWDRKSSVKPPSEQTSEHVVGGHNNIDQTDKYPGLHQQRVPPFFNNAQFRYPPFLQNNNAQFRPGFLNEMNLQPKPQSMIPVIVHSQRNEDYTGTDADNKVTEHYDESGGDGNKDAQESDEHASSDSLIGK